MLHLLGDPKFIQLLINPAEWSLVVRASNRSARMTHRIDGKSFSSKQSCELASKVLIQEIQRVCSCWKSGELYRIYGDMVPSESIARFNLKIAFPISYTQEADDE